jgi:hypothetical protein
MKGLPFIICLLLIIGCQNQHKTSVQLTSSKKDSILKAGWKRQRDSVSRNFETKFLNISKEPDLKLVTNEQYRLIYFCQANFTIYRIENDTGKYFITIKTCRLKSPDGSGFDTLYSTTKKEIKEQGWNEFKEMIDDSYFWGIERTPGERNEFASYELEGHRVTYNPASNSGEEKEIEYHKVGTGGNRKSTLNMACEKLILLGGLKQDSTFIAEKQHK